MLSLSLFLQEISKKYQYGQTEKRIYLDIY